MTEKSGHFHTVHHQSKLFYVKSYYKNSQLQCTVWKLHDFSITQILHEINFGDSRSAKSAISTHVKALNFDSYAFLHFMKAEIYQIDKI